MWAGRRKEVRTIESFDKQRRVVVGSSDSRSEVVVQLRDLGKAKRSKEKEKKELGGRRVEEPALTLSRRDSLYKGFSSFCRDPEIHQVHPPLR